jgi:hypothetical protein
MKITNKWSKDEEGHLLTFDFGKNGKGISDELSIIGKRIEELSKDHCVYLHHKSFIDTADDVYELVFVLIPFSESASEKIESSVEEIAPEWSFYDLDLVSPIRVIDNGNGAFMIVDAQDSEYFFYRNKESGKLAYDGCCVNVENKEIVFDHLKSNLEQVENKEIVFDPLKATPEQLDVVLKEKNTKSLHNTTANGARKNVEDIQIWGNGDTFELICKASSESEGWMKSTKAMSAANSVVVQVTTQQRNPDGSYSIAEALTTVKNAVICEYRDQEDVVVARTIIPRDKMEESISSKIVYLDSPEENN